MRRGTVILGVCLAAVACKKSTTRAAPIAAASTVITANLTAGEQAVVTASHGQVEVVREGTVSAAKVGDRLGVKDALQTQIGEADVAVEGVKLRLHEASRLELKQVEKRAMLARMRGGIESEVDQNARLDMEMEGSDAVAHSQG